MPQPFATRTAAQRIEALADPRTARPIAPLDAPRPSLHLARWGIAPRDDDGVVIRSGEVLGRRVVFAAQDATFLGGAVGERQAAALQELLAHAKRERPAAVVLLAASGGVRLHEANPAELALAHALRALLDVRADGVPVIALACGDVFGGASVLTCAADRVGMLPSARLGLSGPKVIATARGHAELDPADRAAIDAIFGAAARLARGQADLVADDADAIRGWLIAVIAARETFPTAIAKEHAALAAQLARAVASGDLEWSLPAAWRDLVVPVDAARGLFRSLTGGGWIAAAAGPHHVGPERVHALDSALLKHIAGKPNPGGVLLLVEDSLGHEVSRRAEELCLSRFLAHHAAVLALLRQGGVEVRGLLAGCGHSAAFFSHALQATRLVALRDARVVAMEREAVARVTGLDTDALAACIESDPVLGHTAAAFAHWGGVEALLDAPDATALETLLRR